MRFSEIARPADALLTEAILHENFVTNLAKTLGDKAKEKVTVVNNSLTAMVVIYRICSDPHYLETMTFELKRAIKRKVARLTDGKLKQAIISKFPSGRGIRDFFKGLFLVGVLNASAAVKNIIKDQALDALVSQIVDIDALISQLLGGASGAMGMIMKLLDIGNTLMFQLLNALNQKITSAITGPKSANPADEAGGPETAPGVVDSAGANSQANGLLKIQPHAMNTGKSYALAN